MSRALRLTLPDVPYFVTNRTIQGRLLLKPSPFVNNVIGSVLAKATKRYDVEVYAFVFLSNHFHMIIKAAPDQLSPFIAYVESNIARKIGPEVDWKGKFWHRRFSAEPILDDQALENRLGYIFAHGAKEGLVEKPQQWPGLTCFPELLRGFRRTFLWHDATAQYQARQRGDMRPREAFQVPFPLKLTPLPHWRDLPGNEQQKKAKAILRIAEQQAKEAMAGKSPLGVRKVLEQHPHSKPQRSKHSPRPWCHATTLRAKKAFRKLYKEFVNDYKEAAHAFLTGDAHVEFPYHSYRPTLPFHWQPIPAD